MYEDIGRSRGTDFFRIADQLTDEERDYWRRTRDFVDDEVLPVINDYWERAEFPWPLIEKLRRARHRRRRHRRLRLPADEPDRQRADQHGAQPRRRQPRHLPRACRPAWPCSRSPCSGRRSRSSVGCRAWPSCDKLGAFALTEPDHGSDSVGLETSARRDGDDWVINGAEEVDRQRHRSPTSWWCGPATRPTARSRGSWSRRAAPATAPARIDGQGLAARGLAGRDHPDRRARRRRPTGCPARTASRTPARVLAGTRNAVAWAALGHATAAYEIAVAYCTAAHPVRQAAGQLPDRAGASWSRCSPRSARCSCTACGWAG